MDQQDRAARAVAQWRHEMPQMDVAAMEVIGRLNELSALIGRDHLEPHFARFGLQRGEFDVLATLRRSGTPFILTPTDLYEATMMTSGGMTARLDRLEKRGLIARQPNPDDRRGVLVRLTDEGQALVEAAVVPHAQNETRLLSVLSTAERDQLNSLLYKLRAGLPDPQD